MSACRADHAPCPPELVLGFGNTPQRAIKAGIALIGDLLDNRHPPGRPPAQPSSH